MGRPPWRLAMALSAPPIVISRSRRPAWPVVVLPYALGGLVVISLCSFFFVRTPAPPQYTAARPQVVQQPVSLTAAAAQDGPRALRTEETSQPRPAAPLSRDEVREVQVHLQNLRLAPGPADGVAGSRTSDAVRQYQAHKGMQPTGVIDRDLLDLLRNEEQAAR